MDRNRLMTRFLWAVAILWMGFCFFLAWQPGEETANLSGAVTQVVERVIRVFGLEIDLNVLDAWLRRSAHVVTFFIAGALFFCSFARSLKHRPRAGLTSFLLAALVCSVCAVIAEVGKIWIPGRHLQWDETLLNVVGVVSGSAVSGAIRALRRAGGRGFIRA